PRFTAHHGNIGISVEAGRFNGDSHVAGIGFTGAILKLVADVPIEVARYQVVFAARPRHREDLAIVILAASLRLALEGQVFLGCETSLGGSRGHGALLIQIQWILGNDRPISPYPRIAPGSRRRCRAPIWVQHSPPGRGSTYYEMLRFPGPTKVLRA